MDSRAQISAELIIVMAAVLAVALILVKNLGSTAQSASSKMSNKSDDLLREIEGIK